jgi:hypothetical protein
MSIDNLLEVEIEEKLNKISEMEPSTDEYKTAVDSVTKLLDRAIEMNKIDNDRKERKDIREEDTKSRLESEKVEKKKYFIDKVLTALSIGIPAVLTVWGTKKSLKFEETGTVTTIMGRGFINKLLHWK